MYQLKTIPKEFRSWNPYLAEMHYKEDQAFRFQDDVKHKNEGCVVMQWIGLKDKNGKKIFEGDILGGDLENLVVVYIAGMTSFGTQHIGDGSLNTIANWFSLYEDDAVNSSVVVGNVFENPNLIS